MSVGCEDNRRRSNMVVVNLVGDATLTGTTKREKDNIRCW
jgi:hypothetical protein